MILTKSLLIGNFLGSIEEERINLFPSITPLLNISSKINPVTSLFLKV
jgi:hypothetical protein